MKIRSLFDRTLWKFLLVGLLNTLVGNGLMFLLYNLAGLGYWASTAISYALASVMSYFLNKYFTFKMKDGGWRTAVRFAVNIAVCYLIAYGFAKPLVQAVLSGYSEKVRGNVAMLLGMCLFTGLNYLGQRFFAFRSPARFAKRLDKQGTVSLSLSFFIPVVVMTVVFAAYGVWPFGDQQVLAHDMWHQYYPFFVDFRRTLTEGGSLLYSHTSGLGTNYLALYAYYLASPLNLLSVLVPESMLLDFYTVLLAKIGLCGLTFALFLKITFRRSDWSVVPFSVAFALCSYLMGYYWNIMWLDTVAMLPLVIAGAVALLREGRWRLYVFSLALAMWCNYYIGFFVCIAVALLFLGHTICYWDNLRGFFRRLGQLALCSVLGVGLAAILLIPAYLGLQNTYSAINEFPTGLSLNIAEEKTLMGILDAFRQIFAGQMAATTPTAMSGLPNIYCGVAAVFLAGVFCFSGKFRLRERICNCLLLLFFAASFIFRQLDYVWHGFHFPNMLPYRFSFLYSFVVLTMAYRAWSVLEDLKWWHALAGLVAVGCVVACGIGNVPGMVTTGVIGLVMFAIALSYRKLPRWVSTLLLLAICIAEGATCAGLGVGEAGTSSRTVYPKQAEDTQKVMEQMDDSNTDWYRTELTNYQSLNDPALLGYDGVTIFSSTANKAASDFMLHLGLASWPASNRFAYLESSPFTNLMLNIRYLIDREGNHLDPDYNQIVAQSGNVTIQENTAYLPMGFVMREDILEYDVNAARSFPMTVQNKLFTMATGVEGDLYTMLSPTEMDCGEASITKDSSSQNSYYYHAADLTEDPELNISYILSEDTLFCLYFQSKDIQNLRIYVNDAYLADRNVKVGSLLCLGDYGSGTKITLRCTAKAGQTGRIGLQAGQFHKDVFDAGYEILSQSTLNATKVTGHSLSGVIQVKEAGLFYTSIPCEPGWTVKVDGQPVEITPVGDALLAFSIEQGLHTVEISYLTPGLWLGAGISAGCLILVLLLLIFCPKFRVPKPPKPQPEPDSDLEFLLNYQPPEPEPLMPRLEILQTEEHGDPFAAPDE